MRVVVVAVLALCICACGRYGPPVRRSLPRATETPIAAALPSTPTSAADPLTEPPEEVEKDER